jgi:hypothetical protein
MMEGEPMPTTRLWFELASVLRLAEHTRRATTFDPQTPGTPDNPYLTLTLDQQYPLTTTARPAPQREHTLHPVHIDGPAPSHGGPTRHQHLPLITPTNPTAIPLGELLRHTARERHHWLTIDITTTRGSSAPAVAARPWRVIDTVPKTAHWVSATVTAGDLGPYPARVAAGYRDRTGAVPACLDRDQVWRLENDTAQLAAGRPDIPLVEARGDQVMVIRHAGTQREQRTTIPGEPGGWWFRVNAPGLPWTASPTDDTAGADDGVFEPWGPDGELCRCMVCGSVEDPERLEMPSMVGYGYDTSTRCTMCGSSESSVPMFGMSPRRKPWPPLADPSA